MRVNGKGRCAEARGGVGFICRRERGGGGGGNWNQSLVVPWGPSSVRTGPPQPWCQQQKKKKKLVVDWLVTEIPSPPTHLDTLVHSIKKIRYTSLGDAFGQTDSFPENSCTVVVREDVLSSRDHGAFWWLAI